MLQVGVLIIIVGIVLIWLPPVRERIIRRMDKWWIRIVYTIFPPEKEVFVPNEEVELFVLSPSLAPSSPPSSSSTSTPTMDELHSTSIPTTPTPTLLPDSVALNGVRYMDQHYGWNNCAPANLAMALSYWGWEGDREDTAEYLKPFEEDKNVMPYEMEQYIKNQTELSVVVRHGGTPNLVKEFIANGYPVLIEKGTFSFRETTTGRYSWMGHYNVLTGYDDSCNEFIVQDSYVTPGVDHRIPYDELIKEWRSFNYVFIVVHPLDREDNVFEILGDYSIPQKSYEIAYKIASDEIITLIEVDKVFAWYNRGTSMVGLQDYRGAADAYDEAYRLLAELPEEKRPYRLIWYQTGPYFAYFYSGRYQDVIDLADTALIPLERTKKPYLEESYYWRAKAKAVLGDNEGAIEDLCQSLEYHPDFIPSLDEMQNIGISSCP